MNQPRERSHSAAALLFLFVFAFAPRSAAAQSAQEIVRKVVHNELDADFNDHTSWMYRDDYKSPEKNVVKIVVETSQGNLSEIVEESGHPPSAEEHQNDLNRMQQIVVDPALRARQKRAEQHDGEQAADMMKMLPNAFVWHVIDHANGELTLAFQPAPSFSPDSMNAKVLAAMSGIMVVDEQAMRLRKLAGHLDHEVVFGWGILGRINAGGTFAIERKDVGYGSWQIIQTHVHISGHALFFKTIGDQEDEVTSEYHRTPDGVDLKKAAEMLRSGEVARELHLEMHWVKRTVNAGSRFLVCRNPGGCRVVRTSHHQSVFDSASIASSVIGRRKLLPTSKRGRPSGLGGSERIQNASRRRVTPCRSWPRRSSAAWACR